MSGEGVISNAASAMQQVALGTQESRHGGVHVFMSFSAAAAANV